MPELLVFGGTTEGRQLAEWLSGRARCRAVVCTATEYGGELVGDLPGVDALVGPLDAGAKERLMAEHDFACIVDATHPFATHVSQSIAELAERSNVALLRLVREDDESGSYIQVRDVEQAARLVSEMPGNVLLTTGTRDLAVFTQAVGDFAERLFARVLPVADSVGHARSLGIPVDHLIAMKGPFSVELNCALMRELSIDVMVTKASGVAGGFSEKIEAARRCGVAPIVIGRPSREEGLSFSQVKSELEERYGA